MRILLLTYVAVGVLLGTLLPLLATYLESVRLDEGFSSEDFWISYGHIPLVMRVSGPLLLGLIGFVLGSASLRRLREQSIYTEKLRAHSEELKRRNDSLSELNEALDGLIYTASHDLKTPVVNFKGLLTMLKMVKDRPGSEAQVDEIIGKLEASADRFMDTIGNLLDVSRVEKEEVDLEPISIRELVEDIMRDMSEQIRKSQARIEIETQEAEQILMSGAGLRSILQNLLANAIQYTVPDRVPVICVRSLVNSGRFEIRISDNGRGIDLPMNKEKLFRMFSRLSGQTSGTGVGLYIVKRTMERVGGDVQVDSTPGQGTTFQLSFPGNCIP